ncbi:hypothetical protein [Caballeronia pedi]|uniref:hypothetical protein n=1 Tax=Caballeronia pedi TaxID=1777141 RepID=UPI0011788A83|nr:hypothetical protein [Caballeronia pedi]
MRAIATQTQANWMTSVRRAKLWSGEKLAYEESIKVTPMGDFGAVVWTDYRNAADIETGRAPYDLKQMLNTSPKVRRTKDGRRFMIIPFRTNTTGYDALTSSMPQNVYDAASQLKPSKIVGKTMRPTGELTSIHPKWGTRPLKKQTPFASVIATRAAMMTEKHIYKWGTKLDTSKLEGLSEQQRRRWNNMYRFDTGSGAKRSSSFMTFRVMMEGSSGWIIPARPGLYLAKKTADEMRPKAEKALVEAVRRSFK